MYKKILCNEGNSSDAYALPKMHKSNCPFRIKIFSTDSPLYLLASFLYVIISEKSPKPFSKTENSFYLTQNLRDRRLETNFSLISLDVISLFTNIPFDLAIVANR